MPLEDLERGLYELAEAEEDYSLAELYYEGRNPEHFASLRMARALRAYEHKYRLRLAKIPVDAVADRLEIAAVTVNPMERGEDQDQVLSQTLQDDVRDANDMDVTEAEVTLRACEYGDAYVIVDQDPEGRVSLYYNSPFECRIIYDRSGRYKQFAIKVWSDVDDRGLEFLRATLFYNDAIEEYATKSGHDGANVQDWTAYGDGTPYLNEDQIEVVEDGVHLYPFGQIPVFHFRTARPHGRPEHEAAYGPQDMIDKLTISQMSTTDFQVFPQRYFLEDPNFDGADGDEDWGDDDASASTPSASTPKLQASPGEVWFMTGVKTAGQFAAADPDAFLKPLQFLGKAMAATSNTPFPLFDDDTTTSGEDRRVKESGQTRKIKKRQKQFGATWRQVYAYCLSLITGDDFDTLLARIEVRWVPAESIDPAEAWELAGKKKGVGLPLIQILLEHGYSQDTIDRMMEMALEEREEQIELQQRAFASTHQGNRDDRPDQANPGNVDAETGGTTT